jgi:dihydroneopterin aldolase
MKQPDNLQPFPGAGAEAGLRRVLVRDLVLPARIGVHKHERDGPQRVRINLDLGVREGAQAIDDDLANVVNYAEIVAGIRKLIGGSHVNLVETLAERIAGMCLADARVRAATVRVEKLDVYADVAAVGVEIERHSRLP